MSSSNLDLVKQKNTKPTIRCGIKFQVNQNEDILDLTYSYGESLSC